MPDLYIPDPKPSGWFAIPSQGLDGDAHSVVVSLNNAQIKALPTTPVIIVPATETLGYVGNPTQVPLVEHAVIHWKVFGGVAYGNVGAGSFLGFFIGSDAGNNGSQQRIEAVQFMGSAAPLLSIAQISSGGRQNDALLNARLYDVPASLLDSIEDNAISFAAVNAGDFTGGHANDVIQVSLTYRIFNTQTGEFE